MCLVKLLPSSLLLMKAKAPSDRTQMPPSSSHPNLAPAPRRVSRGNCRLPSLPSLVIVVVVVIFSASFDSIGVEVESAAAAASATTAAAGGRTRARAGGRALSAADASTYGHLSVRISYDPSQDATCGSDLPSFADGTTTPWTVDAKTATTHPTYAQPTSPSVAAGRKTVTIATGRRFRALSAPISSCPSGTGWSIEVVLNAESTRNVQVLSCINDDVLVVALHDDDDDEDDDGLTPSSSSSSSSSSLSLTDDERAFFWNMAKSLSRTNPSNRPDLSTSLEYHTINAARLLASWPDGVPVRYVLDALEQRLLQKRRHSEIQSEEQEQTQAQGRRHRRRHRHGRTRRRIDDTQDQEQQEVVVEEGKEGEEAASQEGQDVRSNSSSWFRDAPSMEGGPPGTDEPTHTHDYRPDNRRTWTSLCPDLTRYMRPPAYDPSSSSSSSSSYASRHSITVSARLDDSPPCVNDVQGGSSPAGGGWYLWTSDGSKKLCVPTDYMQSRRVADNDTRTETTNESVASGTVTSIGVRGSASLSSWATTTMSAAEPVSSYFLPDGYEDGYAAGSCFGRCGSGCGGGDGDGDDHGDGTYMRQYTYDCAAYDFCRRFGIGADENAKDGGDGGDGDGGNDGCGRLWLDNVDDWMWAGNCDLETREEVVYDDNYYNGDQGGVGGDGGGCAALEGGGGNKVTEEDKYKEENGIDGNYDEEEATKAEEGNENQGEQEEKEEEGFKDMGANNAEEESGNGSEQKKDDDEGVDAPKMEEEGEGESEQKKEDDENVGTTNATKVEEASEHESEQKEEGDGDVDATNADKEGKNGSKKKEKGEEDVDAIKAEEDGKNESEQKEGGDEDLEATNAEETSGNESEQKDEGEGKDGKKAENENEIEGASKEIEEEEEKNDNDGETTGKGSENQKDEDNSGNGSNLGLGIRSSGWAVNDSDPFGDPRERYLSAMRALKPYLEALLTAESRGIDGRSNNAAHPDWGAASTPLLRTAPANYGVGGDDGGNGAVMAGKFRPNPRVISNALMRNGVGENGVATAESKKKRKNTRGLSDMTWQWGQFLDHDVVHTDTNVSFSSESRPIAVPKGDDMLDPDGIGNRTMPFIRSVHVLDADGTRQQINGLTSYIDGSVVYGSEDVRASALRTYEGGMLLTSNDEGNGEEYMPYNTEGHPNSPHGMPDPNLFLGGDVRSNEQIGLTAIHTVFVREHNLCARAVADVFADEEEKVKEEGGGRGGGGGGGGGRADARREAPTDEEIYQLCRRLVSAEIQAITYNEFLPAILGSGGGDPAEGEDGRLQSLFPPYDIDKTYDPTINPSVSNEFSIAYRVGHIMLSDAIQIVGPGKDMIDNGPVPLENAFFNNTSFLTYGVDSILRGLSAQRCHDVEPMVVEAVRSMLFGSIPHAGMDLAALNVQRGRDHGLASYNDVRESYGLRRAESIRDVVSDPDMVAKLEGLYLSVDDIDLWVGCVAEDHYGDAMVGPTLFHLLMDQFYRLRNGDRFWYERDLGKVSKELVTFVNEQLLSEVIVRNTGIATEEIPRRAMADAWM